MTVNLSKLIYVSTCSGFKNYSNVSFSGSIAGQSLAAGHVASMSCHTPLNNTNAVSQVQVQFSGVETVWRPVYGGLAINYPNNTSPSYQIEVVTYFSGGNIYLDAYVSNQTGTSVTIPSITFNVRAFLFNAPF